MTEIEGHPLTDAQKAVLVDLWNTIQKHGTRGELTPVEMLAMLAQCMGAVIAGASIEWHNADELSELISLNLDCGFQGMERALHEGAGHA